MLISDVRNSNDQQWLTISRVMTIEIEKAVIQVRDKCKKIYILEEKRSKIEEISV